MRLPHIHRFPRPMAARALLHHTRTNRSPKRRPTCPDHMRPHLGLIVTPRTSRRRRRNLQIIRRIHIHRPQRRQSRLRTPRIHRAPQRLRRDRQRITPIHMALIAVTQLCRKPHRAEVIQRPLKTNNLQRRFTEPARMNPVHHPLKINRNLRSARSIRNVSLVGVMTNHA